MGFTSKLKRSRHGVSMKLRVRDPRPTQTVQDGLSFVASLKRVFACEPDKYDEIIATMRQFKSGRSIDSLFVLSVNCSIRSAVVVERVKVLLEGHPGLLRHFNQFLPWGYIRAHGPVGRISV
ncbi:paired amphipathic helix protein Sin3-like 6 isoform X1 [Zea mays]|uniref:Uncharacterized protein n=1 Tax=Zea mays TaxID=4577 RepID=A0A804ULH0_MAIZE|nr:paired amphipathic helix protein Sin3-like 6 isoform X1 [Zea mays]|eukprot:XP_008662759.1 paired amphipathic helix protein Sin3-like 6 isoform X1 [Zea mays]